MARLRWGVQPVNRSILLTHVNTTSLTAPPGDQSSEPAPGRSEPQTQQYPTPTSQNQRAPSLEPPCTDGQTPPASVEGTQVLLPVSSEQQLSEDEIQSWTREIWADEVLELQSYTARSWGTAYQTVAEVQLLLRIGRRYCMATNFALHHVSAGRFRDGDGQERTINVLLLGSYLTGQATGTWANKLTFFFAVHHFINVVAGQSRDSVPDNVYEVYQAMLSWDVSVESRGTPLPCGDPRAKYLVTPTRTLMRKHCQA